MMHGTELSSISNRIAEQALFHDMIRRVAGQPDTRGSVLTDSHDRCHYAEIPAYVDGIRQHLVECGVASGDTLILELNNSLRAALTVLAVLDAGYSFMTMPARGRGARAVGDTVQHARFGRWLVSIDAAPKTVLANASPSDFVRVSANDAYDAEASEPGKDGPRVFFRTSGSLGTAKLAMYRYDNLYHNVLNALSIRGFDPSHRIALPTPIFHVYGLGAGFLAGLAGGSTIDLQDRSNVLKYFEREAEFEPNVAYVTPPFCEMLIRSRRSPRPYAFMVVSGDRISETTFRRCEALHGTMVNQYGATEMGVVSASSLDDPLESRARTVGRPVQGAEIRIVELPAAAGNADCGELQIRHAYGFEGYVDLDGRRLVPPNAFDGDWYRTGDLASIASDGTLSVLGRCDLSVNRDGVLLPLADIESRMRELAGVEEVAVVATDAETLRGRALVAFCVLGRKAVDTGSALRSKYAGRAPAFAVPDIVRVVSSLPKLESGKIDRRALAQLAREADAT